MNLILFHRDEADQPLVRNDRRFRHIKKYLKPVPGDCFKAGILNGPVGMITILEITSEKIRFRFNQEGDSIPLHPIRLIVGTPRPQQVKRIVRDCTSMGIEKLWFVDTDAGEKSYRDSPVWNTETLDALLIEGLEQSGTTIPPDIQHFSSLDGILDLSCQNSQTIILDHIQGSDTLLSILNQKPISGPLTLIIGSERGWSDRERALFSDKNLQFATMNNRILRTDTAAIASAMVAILNLRTD